LKSPNEKVIYGAEPMLVSNTDDVIEYLFVAYAAEQFKSKKDLEALYEIAERATRDARLPAYWLACRCMPDDSEREEDVCLNSQT
jgi:hypothetical protein